MYFIGMIGNSFLLFIIKVEHNLHEPIYIFVGMLGATDIALASSIMPKMLGVFWFRIPEI
jgi:olfactory receptor